MFVIALAGVLLAGIQSIAVQVESVVNYEQTEEEAVWNINLRVFRERKRKVVTETVFLRWIMRKEEKYYPGEKTQEEYLLHQVIFSP